MDGEDMDTLFAAMGLCNHTSAGAIRQLRRLLEIGALNGDDETWWIGQLQLDAAAPVEDNRDGLLCWITAAGLIEHDEGGDPDSFTLSARGREVLMFLREGDGDDEWEEADGVEADATTGKKPEDLN